jgi:ribonucleotide monophosphatase NagD (HAD superfamily)
MIKTVIFADLDGTFLDDKYNYDRTKPIVDQLSALGGSVVFCSSKTRDEIEFYRKAVASGNPSSPKTEQPYTFLKAISRSGTPALKLHGIMLSDWALPMIF